MLEVKSVTAQLDAGATLADIATSNSETLVEVMAFAQLHNLEERRFTQFNHMRESLVTERHPADRWERLVADDPDCQIVNGIDTRTCSHDITALDVLRYYEPDRTVRCRYTGEPTDVVMAADNSPPNLLVSNLVPITQQVLEQRFHDTAAVLQDYRETYIGPHPYGPDSEVQITVTVEHKFDKVLGSGLNEPLMSAAFEQWIAPYIKHHTADAILGAYGLPGTPFLTALWVWRQLERYALVKGLARVSLRVGRHTAYVTKQTVLNQVRAMLQRSLSGRVIATAQPAVMPPPGQPAPPARLIKL